MRELLFTLTKKDFEVQTFKSSGHGGQKINKTDSAVRIIHRASGAVGESRSDRSQHRNKQLAFRHLAASPKFRLWLNWVAYEITSGKTIEERVEEVMKPENLKIEMQDENGKWIKEELIAKEINNA